MKYTNASFFLFQTLSLTRPIQTLALLLEGRVVLTPCWLLVDRMPGNTNQHTAAATVRVGASSGDGADLSTHFHLVGEGGAGDAMQECDSAGAGDPSTASFTGDSKPAANRSRKWFQYASVTGWDRAQAILVQLSDA